MSNNHSVIDKVARLLRLAEGEGTNPNEAAVAAATAARLMAEHRLERSDVDGAELDEEPIEVPEAALHIMKRRVPWITALGAGVARSQGCRTYLRINVSHLGRQTKLSLVRRKSDIEATRYLFTYLHREIARLCDLARNARAIDQGLIAANSFRMGAVEVVIRRLREAREEATHDFARARGMQRATTALARVDQRDAAVELWMKKAMNLEKQRPGTRQSYDQSAVDAGRRAGRSIELRRGIEGGHAPRELKGTGS